MTEAQLNARRENAKHSTGPRTDAGKKRSSLNAFRHGLTGQIVVHTPEDQEAFTKHCDGIREALAPTGAIEIDLAQAKANMSLRTPTTLMSMPPSPKAAPGSPTPVSFSSCLSTKAASAVRWKRTWPSSIPCRPGANPPPPSPNRERKLHYSSNS